MPFQGRALRPPNGTIDDSEYDSATLSYDRLGRLTGGINADWYPTAFVYDDVDRLIRGTDDTGNLRDYCYDANGNPMAESLTVAVNGVPTLMDSARASYDLSDRKETGTDAGGFVSTYRYDAAGNVVEIANPDTYKAPVRQ